ncbi:hypothetical protein Vadar_000739 [Vaccinium darrowii]|uniref:Uncharacterized protein n=1 Tax=Vaccinium darrowii TaxID=229202 RepID=A0ACB7XMZ9_9ERIC|nr:hypothetical protein Vadar_000739 [Vaccinium darrowii]
MSLNCKHSRSNSKFSSSLKLKKSKEPLHESDRVWKWRTLLLFLCLLGAAIIGFIWVFSGLNDGTSKDETLNLPQDKDRGLLEHFNVSKGQFHDSASLFHGSDQKMPLQCAKNVRDEMLPINVACAMKGMCSEKQGFASQHGVIAENVEFRDQCPFWEEDVPRKRGLYLPEDNSLSSASCSMSTAASDDQSCQKRKAFGARVKEQCQSFSFCSVNACWWIFLVVILSCLMPCLCQKLLGNEKWKLFQQQLPPLQRQQQPVRTSSKSTGNWRLNFLIGFVIAGVLFSGFLYWYISTVDVSKRKDMLANMCEERARMLQDQFNVSMNHVHALAIFVSTFHHGKEPSAIDQKTFGGYTERTAFKRPLTSGVAYALRVLHADREEFEKEHGWTIKKMETEDQTLIQDCDPENLDPSPPQDEYAPVIFSQETVSHIVSIDMMSGKFHLPTPGINLMITSVANNNYLPTHLPPDATPEQRINATVGYLGASYDVPSLVEKLLVLHQLASKQIIVVHVYDTTNKNEPIKMYGPDDVIDTGLLHISTLEFGDPARKHEMQCRFKQKPTLNWTAIMASGGALIITFLLFHIFNAARLRIAKVEHDYREMMELKHRAEAADVAKTQGLFFPGRRDRQIHS